VTWGAPAHAWAKLKALFGRGPKEALPALETTTFEYPTPDVRTGTTTTTVHTRSVLTEHVECSISSTPFHDIQIVVVDNVVKAISSPCDRTSALTAAQLGGASCAKRYEEIRAWLLGQPKRWSDIIDSRDPLDNPIEEARRRRIERHSRGRSPASERLSPRVWEAFIRRATGLSAQIVAATGSAQVYVETPGVASRYDLIIGGAGSIWALAQGPGDQRVYDALNKYIKLNSRLVTP